MVAVLALFDQEKAQLSAIQITEQPRLLTKSKINRPSYKFSKYILVKNGDQISYSFSSSS